MTAQIMTFTGRRVRQPQRNPSNAEKVPARLMDINRLSPEKDAQMRNWAEERLADAIRVYRATFSSEELAARLSRAITGELTLIERARG